MWEKEIRKGDCRRSFIQEYPEMVPEGRSGFKQEGKKGGKETAFKNLTNEEEIIQSRCGEETK
jgi:hypothetical protein